MEDFPLGNKDFFPSSLVFVPRSHAPSNILFAMMPKRLYTFSLYNVRHAFYYDHSAWLFGEERKKEWRRITLTFYNGHEVKVFSEPGWGFAS